MTLAVNANNLHVLECSPRRVSQTESSDLLRRLKQVARGGFFSSDRGLSDKLKSMQPIELDQLLRDYFANLSQEDDVDPIKNIERLAAVIPLERLEAATLGDRADALQEAKGMFEEAKLYLSSVDRTTSPTLRNQLITILEGIVSAIESILSAVGMSDFFRPSESDIHADFKGQKIMMLLSLFGLIATTILPIIGADVGVKIIGGILLAIIALSIVWPLIKPMPTNLPANAENWTREIRNGGCQAQGRKESLDEMANILKMGRHVMLVGPSRVGKSLTAKAFAQAIERGDYPELKGKCVFRINTGDIVDQKASFLGGGNNILHKISAAMGRHAKDIILVLDEVHMACKNKAKIADQLKTFLDQGGQFPHVIGITTAQEYDRYVKDNQAFALRFDRVDIQNTSQDETIKILSDTVLQKRTLPLLDEGVLQQIYTQASSDAPQPMTSLNILQRSINRTEQNQRTETEKKITALTNKIVSLRSQAAATRGKTNIRGQIEDLEQQLNFLQQSLISERERFAKLHQTKALLNQVTKEAYKTVVKVAAPSFFTSMSHQEKRFLLLHKFLIPALESTLKQNSAKLGVPLFIDQSLVQQVSKG